MGVWMVLQEDLDQYLSSYQTWTKSIIGFGNNEVLMKKRIISNAYQIPPPPADPPPPTPPRWSMTKTNIKNTSYLTKTIFFGMTLLHAHAQYIYIVNAKYHKPSVKALVQVDFPVYAQAKSLSKSKQEKNGSFQKAIILSKNIFLASNFFMRMCSGTSWLPCVCTIEANAKQENRKKWLSSQSCHLVKN